MMHSTPLAMPVTARKPCMARVRAFMDMTFIRLSVPHTRPAVRLTPMATVSFGATGRLKKQVWIGHRRQTHGHRIDYACCQTAPQRGHDAGQSGKDAFQVQQAHLVATDECDDQIRHETILKHSPCRYRHEYEKHPAGIVS